MSRLRILVLAPDANPESISLALEGFSHSEALARLHCVTLVARAGNEQALRKAQAPYQAIEAIDMPWLERFYGWCIRHIFNNNFHSRVLTPFSYPFSLAFEWRTWQRMRTRILAGEFDVVMRLLPANPVLPSPFPFFLRKSSVPCVVGPINGGLPWPQGFSQAENQKSRIDVLRSLYRLMPFARSTYGRAAAIMAGSSQTYAEFSEYGEKLFFVAENGVRSEFCSGTEVRHSHRDDRLELIFLGALVPYKACDLALRGAAAILRTGAAHFTIVGDGPERSRLEELTESLGIEGSVSFCGMLTHAAAMERLVAADVMVFPSVREFGGAVVVEALAAGAVPIVAAFGGPGDTVRPDVGFKVDLTNEDEVVQQIERILGELASNRDLLNQLRKQGINYIRECLTWEAKAKIVTRVMEWVVARGPKPDLPPPRALMGAQMNSPK